MMMAHTPGGGAEIWAVFQRLFEVSVFIPWPAALWTQIYGISKRTNGTPVAGVGPVLAAIAFAGTCMWRWGWGLGWFHSSHRWAWCLTSKDLYWWICTGGFVNTVPKEHPVWLPKFLWLRLSWGKWKQQCTLWACTTGDRWHHEAHELPGEQLLQWNMPWLFSL